MKNKLISKAKSFIKKVVEGNRVTYHKPATPKKKPFVIPKNVSNGIGVGGN